MRSPVATIWCFPGRPRKRGDFADMFVGLKNVQHLISSAIFDAVKKPTPSNVDEETVETTEPIILEDSAVDSAALKELRAAYRELRAAYTGLHERHHERITKALADLKDEDKKTGGDVPYGYRLDSDNETLVEDEAEQTVIAEAVRLHEQGLSLRRIAKELWKLKLRPRRVPRERQRGGLKTKRFGEFDPTQIRRMIDRARAKFD